VAGYLVSADACIDLLEIWKYIARDSIRQADLMYARFEETFAALARRPGIGVVCDHIGAGVRRFPLGHYLIYFRKEGGSVVISRVLHGMRQQKKVYRQRV
jgi:toxin ParE1/3/4